MSNDQLTGSVLTPFEKNFRDLNNSAIGIFSSLVIDLDVKQVLAYEAELSKLGYGCPPLQNTIEIGMMWHSVADHARKQEH